MTVEAAPAAAASSELAMREELARGDAALSTVAPILRHLVANEDQSLFSDEIVARVRGMFGDLALQLRGESNGVADDPAASDALAAVLLDQPALLAHLHALALESQLSERLHARQSLDPVLSPLIQELIASPDADISGTAMAVLAAQARFVQSQRRMQLPLSELPADLAHLALSALRTVYPHAASEPLLRERYDESRSRLGLIARLVTSLGGGATAALAVGHAGLGIFLSASALASRQDRDGVVLSATDRQALRLALTLRAAGLRPAAIDEQLAALLPEVPLPQTFEALGPTRAAALLALPTR